LRVGEDTTARLRSFRFRPNRILEADTTLLGDLPIR
jgi:hypothetical protein